MITGQTGQDLVPESGASSSGKGLVGQVGLHDLHMQVERHGRLVDPLQDFDICCS